jgi:hypothetical protein
VDIVLWEFNASRRGMARPIIQVQRKKMDTDTRPLESEPSSDSGEGRAHLPGWIKVGSIAAASALAGGLAAAWFYRKTLSRLQNAEQIPPDSNFGMPEKGTADED